MFLSVIHGLKRPGRDHGSRKGAGRPVLSLFCLLILLLAAGCGGSDQAGRTASQAAGVKDVLEAGAAQAESVSEADTQEAPETDGRDTSQQSGLNQDAPAPAETTGAQTANAQGVDVDLTALSSTMVYSEVYNMMAGPETYIGKTIRMAGEFRTYHDDATGADYYACIIQDATACCAQGIEFVLTEDYVYPDDYPEIGKNVTVEGIFSTYQEGDSTYCTLKKAKLL